MIDVLMLNATYHKKYAKGQRIQSGDADREMYVVYSGEVDAYRLAPQTGLEKTGTLGPGEAFAQEWFFGGEEGRVYMAKSDAVLFVVAQSGFDNMVRTQPRIAYALLEEGFCPRERQTAGQWRAALQRRVAESAAAKKGAQSEPAAAKNAPPKSGTDAAQSADATNPGLFPAGHRGYADVTHPEYAQFTFKAEFTCPYCGKTFKGDKIFASKLVDDGPMRYDFRHKYRDFSKEWYDVATCPHCCFSAQLTFFAEPKAIDKGKIKAALEQACAALPKTGGARTLEDVFASHYLALLCAAGLREHRRAAMLLWSSVSWLYEDAGDEALMRHAAAEAAGAAERLYMESELTPPQEQQVCMIIAAMQYRAGVDSDRRKWLYKAKTMEGGKKHISELADRLQEIMRAEGADMV